MKVRVAVSAMLALLVCAGLFFFVFSGKDEPSAQQYAVGDRLPSQPSPAPAASAETEYQEIRWEALAPASWNPASVFEGFNLDDIDDGSPQAIQLMQQFLEKWNEAPANPEMDGKRVKLPGFVAPLDFGEGRKLREFLLVPYFGACIHVPPPPANQIVFVQVGEPVDGIGSMDAVWVYGQIQIERTDTQSGVSGYRMRADRVEVYSPPKEQEARGDGQAGEAK
ncbi:MAG: DUF3299 domain-containing protein [Azoarcus sp.]|jgi:hypothetical protein|nr:DUF3299 domain-containing protein [Azoarcus sp.]